MAGRKPLPTAVKKIKGTLQKCRTNNREPQPQGDLVEPPEYMAEGAKQAWRYAIESAPAHLLRRLDMSVLEVWSCAADLYRKAQAGITKTGLLVKAPEHCKQLERAVCLAFAIIEFRLTTAAIGHTFALNM